jgi:hypothetical protein
VLYAESFEEEGFIDSLGSFTSMRSNASAYYLITEHPDFSGSYQKIPHLLHNQQPVYVSHMGGYLFSNHINQWCIGNSTLDCDIRNSIESVDGPP